jgi:hypothetical protein
VYASVADVKRILQLTDTSQDEAIRVALAAVESWAQPLLGNLTVTGDQSEMYYDVREDATLYLPQADVVVTCVRVHGSGNWWPGETWPWDLGYGRNYDVTDDGRVLLRPFTLYAPFEGAWAQRQIRTFDRVEVFYTASGRVPPAVTEGIAFIAAGYHKDGPRALTGLTSERIGDYSYTLGDAAGTSGEGGYVGRGMFFLQNYLPRARVMTT